MVSEVHDSSASARLLAQIDEVLAAGQVPLHACFAGPAAKCDVGGAQDAKQVQMTPHLVLLDRRYYHAQLEPLLAEWMLVWLGSKDMSHVDVSRCGTVLFIAKAVAAAAYA